MLLVITSSSFMEFYCNASVASLGSGVRLPYAYYCPPASSALVVGADGGAAVGASAGGGAAQRLHMILGHGLGAKNPANTGYMDDKWIALVAEQAYASGLQPVVYTARGHKGSQGWEDSAESDPDQFTWNRLSQDMMDLATQELALERVVVGGSSMGSATALLCVMNNPPELFLGLIMVRPPTAWETRKARRKFLLSSANKCQESSPEGDASHWVLRGAANGDLPSTTDDKVDETYGRVTCPTLILAVRNDDAHPLATAEALHAVLPHSILHIAEDLGDASEKWPAVIREFSSSLV